MNTIKHEPPPKPACHVWGCPKPVYMIEPLLPTLFCDEHRALAVAESKKIRANNRRKP